MARERRAGRVSRPAGRCSDERLLTSMATVPIGTPVRGQELTVIR